MIVNAIGGSTQVLFGSRLLYGFVGLAISLPEPQLSRLCVTEAQIVIKDLLEDHYYSLDPIKDPYWNQPEILQITLNKPGQAEQRVTPLYLRQAAQYNTETHESTLFCYCRLGLLNATNGRDPNPLQLAPGEAITDEEGIRRLLLQAGFTSPQIGDLSWATEIRRIPLTLTQNQTALELAQLLAQFYRRWLIMDPNGVLQGREYLQELAPGNLDWIIRPGEWITPPTPLQLGQDIPSLVVVKGSVSSGDPFTPSDGVSVEYAPRSLAIKLNAAGSQLPGLEYYPVGSDQIYMEARNQGRYQPIPKKRVTQVQVSPTLSFEITEGLTANIIAFDTPAINGDSQNSPDNSSRPEYDVTDGSGPTEVLARDAIRQGWGVRSIVAIEDVYDDNDLLTRTIKSTFEQWVGRSSPDTSNRNDNLPEFRGFGIGDTNKILKFIRNWTRESLNLAEVEITYYRHNADQYVIQKAVIIWKKLEVILSQNSGDQDRGNLEFAAYALESFPIQSAPYNRTYTRAFLGMAEATVTRWIPIQIGNFEDWASEVIEYLPAGEAFEDGSGQLDNGYEPEYLAADPRVFDDASQFGSYNRNYQRQLMVPTSRIPYSSSKVPGGSVASKGKLKPDTTQDTSQDYTLIYYLNGFGQPITIEILNAPTLSRLQSLAELEVRRAVYRSQAFSVQIPVPDPFLENWPLLARAIVEEQYCWVEQPIFTANDQGSYILTMIGLPLLPLEGVEVITTLAESPSYAVSQSSNYAGLPQANYSILVNRSRFTGAATLVGIPGWIRASWAGLLEIEQVLIQGGTLPGLGSVAAQLNGAEIWLATEDRESPAGWILWGSVSGVADDGAPVLVLGERIRARHLELRRATGVAITLLIVGSQLQIRTI